VKKADSGSLLVGKNTCLFYDIIRQEPCSQGVDRFVHAALIAEDLGEPLLHVAAAETAIEALTFTGPVESPVLRATKVKPVRIVVRIAQQFERITNMFSNRTPLFASQSSGLYNLVPGASQRVVTLIICEIEKDGGPRLISVA